MRPIVVAIDFSESSEAVLKTASEMAAALRVALHLVHIVDSAPLYTMYGMHPEEIPAIVEYRDVALQRAEDKLTEIAGKMPSVSGLAGHHTKVLEGAPMDELLNYAKEVNAVMIVTGTHGHSALGSVLMGSVASGLVRKAELPVLVVPVR